MTTFNQYLQFGKIGEGHIASWLREHKQFNVLPVYEKEIQEGKGPVLFAVEGNLIAPDLFCFRQQTDKPNDVLWIEAKTKSAFTWHRKTRRWVTGIDLKHYGDYLKIAGLSPWPVWLLFLHLPGRAKDTPTGMQSPTGLFGNDLEYLAQNENHRHDNWAQGMVYWAHKNLIQMAALEDVVHTIPTFQQSEKP